SSAHPTVYFNSSRDSSPASPGSWMAASTLGTSALGTSALGTSALGTSALGTSALGTSALSPTSELAAEIRGSSSSSSAELQPVNKASGTSSHATACVCFMSPQPPPLRA